jgi:hypothetical protein
MVEVISYKQTLGCRYGEGYGTHRSMCVGVGGCMWLFKLYKSVQDEQES